MRLLVCTVDPDEGISFVLGLGKLDAKLCDFVTYQSWMSVKHESGWHWTHLNFGALREARHEGNRWFC